MKTTDQNSNDKNHLSKEKSPYLLQHADNPVHWFPWGKEAFKKAKQEDKPVFLSIGYSTCHWCHVMAHESFENSEIAQILNERFVSIKVDREERPDIDSIYMSTVTALTGSGGWPLSVFLTPEQKPFFGGTYYPPEPRWGAPGFKDLLISISETWKNQRENVLRSGDSIADALQNRVLRSQGDASLTEETFLQAFQRFNDMFDERFGGFGNAPKFPSSHNLSFLLRYWYRKKESHALEIVEKTLTQMARGGMYDQLGGGFHRYSTDERWHVPHFEKMLYDQALLTKTYLEAYQITRNSLYADVARETFEYVLREMTSPEGGFYSAEDADSVETQDVRSSEKTSDELGSRKSDVNNSKTSHIPHPTPDVKKEGAFYVWSESEIRELLGEEQAKIFNYYFGVEPTGNATFDPHGEFVGKNILYVAHSIEETATQFNREMEEIVRIIKDAKQTLFKHRGVKPRPHLDDKILVDWNGLMISALAFGARVLNEPRYQQAAQRAVDFILKELINAEGRLLHSYRQGPANILGTLEDYAFFINSLIDVYEATFEISYLKQAKRLSDEMIRLFWDEIAGGFFMTGNDAEKLILRQKEIYDGAIPSGNSMAAFVLIRLAHFTFNQELEKRVEVLFRTFATEINQAPYGYSQMLIAFDFALGPVKEIVISANGEESQMKDIIKQIFERFLPRKVVMLYPTDPAEAKKVAHLLPLIAGQTGLPGQPTIYVCENHQCQLPTTEISQLETLLSN